MYDINLYPPIFNQSYAPAFLRNVNNSFCKIYFQISSLNSINDLNQNAVQVIVRQQKTNNNALDSRYTNAILLKKLYTQGDKYYISINNDDINGGFVADAYYKVQIRFTETAAPSPPSATYSSFGTWLTNNLQYFSQWSSVFLIRGINQPTTSLTINNSTDTNVSVSMDHVRVAGTVSFAGTKEKLQKYSVKLYKNGILEEDSGDIYAADNGSFQYIIKESLSSNSTYSLHVTFVSNNLYSWSIDRTIQVTDIEPITSNMALEEQANNNSGYIKLTIKRNSGYSSSSILFSRNYRAVIRRSSSRDNFLKWVTLEDHTIEKNSLTYLYFYDYTAEPGVWYRYQIIRYNSSNSITAVLETPLETPLMLDTNEIFLNNGEQELIVRFNPVINSLSNKVVQSINETLGSRYPFIRYNGNVNYKTFSLSGTISYFMDIQSNRLKASKQDVFGDAIDLYKTYNQQNKIGPHNDYFYQKFFRQKVIDFLQSKDIKLFRSLSEGNILVKLSGVTLTPNQTLDRMIYDFSCTVYEVAECNEQNYKKYNILKNSIEQV